MWSPRRLPFGRFSLCCSFKLLLLGRLPLRRLSIEPLPLNHLHPLTCSRLNRIELGDSAFELACSSGSVVLKALSSHSLT